MAARLIQAPLPWLPEDAAEVARGVGLVTGDDGSGQVWVHGMLTFCWDAGDEAGRKLAAVQLVATRAARVKEVAAAWGEDPATIWRWKKTLGEGGVAALVPARRGPKGPSKLTPELTGLIRELRAEGKSHAAIAAAAGVSQFAVRTALGTAGAGSAAPAGDEARPAPAGQPELPGQPEPAEPVLPVLPDPVVRDGERALARFGFLGEGAEPVFVPAAKVPYAGLLLAFPALASAGLLGSARQVYGGLKSGFYGLETMLITLVFLALLRLGRAENAAQVPPAALGRVLGLDRAPEVKTIRRKLAELAAAGKAADLQMAMAKHHAATRPDDLGILYVDGHTRAYFGTRDVQKMHLGRLGRPGPGTEETWVTDGRGNPLLVVMAQPCDSLAAQLRELLPDLRKVCGENTKPLLCFDRGGWSPDLFADIIDAGFDLLSYRKAAANKPVPGIDPAFFATRVHAGDDGRRHEYEVADTRTELPVTTGTHKGEVLDLRQVTKLDHGKQIHIVTTRDALTLPAAAAIYSMTGRWREENYFRYGRAHFSLDALDSYAVTPDDPDRKIPNPAKKAAAAAVKKAKAALASAETARQARLDALRRPDPGTTAVITNADLAALGKPVDAARRKLQAAQDAAKATPAKIPLSQHKPGMVRLDTETKLITHAIRMAAFNTETALARALHGRYPRAGDEAYALIRQALATSGDIIPGDGTLTIRLDPLSADRYTRALAALCDTLNTAGVRYPGTQLLLRYEVKTPA